MSFQSWLRNRRSVLASGQGQHKPQRQRLLRTATHRLDIEALECRRLLSAGQLDPSFDVDGKVVIGVPSAGFRSRAVAVQGDGKTVVVGAAPNGHEGEDAVIARLNFNGSLDTTFGPSHTGIVRIHVGDLDNNTAAHAVTFAPGGGILVAGSQNEFLGAGDADGDMMILKLTPNGVLDSSFAGGGKETFDFGVESLSSEADGIAVQSDGKIVLVGYSGVITSLKNEFAMIRLKANGLLDNSFDDDGRKTIDFDNDASASAVAIDYSGTPATNPHYGTIVVGGSTTGGADDSGKFALIRVTPGGTLDASFHGGGQFFFAPPHTENADVGALAIQPNGKIIAAGHTAGNFAADVFTMARLTPAGLIDSTFGAAGTGFASVGFGDFNEGVTSMLIGQDNRLILGGYSGQKMAFAAFSANGLLDHQFGTLGKVTVNIGVDLFGLGMAYGPGNRIVATGGPFNVVRIQDTDARQVSATTILNTAVEEGPTPVSFFVTRTERLPVPTRVFFTIGGTATAPTLFALRNHTVDYTLSGMTIPIFGLGQSSTPFVEIPADQTFVLVTVTPVNDGLTEPTETATFTIKNDSSYDAVTPLSVNLNIIDKNATVTKPLNPTADAYVRDGDSAATNFGATPDLQVKKSATGFNRMSYLKFDLTNVKSISHAEIQLEARLTDPSNPSIDTSIFPVADTSWTETGITFNNAPAAGPNPLSTATITGLGGDIFKWDVTSYVQAQKAAGHNIVSFVLKDLATTNTVVLLNSREAAANKPQLLVDVPASGAVGKFKVSSPADVNAGQSTKVAVTWTVPSGSWHQLHDIDLRLRGDNGSLNQIHWDEANKTFALFDFASGKLGAAKALGSDGVLSNDLVDVLLKTSSIQASGPTSPVVNVTFDLRFHTAVGDRHFDIDAAASNDSGAQAVPVRGAGVNVHVPRISVTDVKLAEGNNGTKAFVFRVSLTRAATVPVSVQFSTENVTAAHGSDYVARGGVLVFNAGDPLTKTVRVQVIGDTTPETDQLFNFNLFDAVNAVIADPKGKGTILNDD